MRTLWLLSALGLHAALGGIVMQAIEPPRVDAHVKNHRAPEPPALRAELLPQAPVLRTQYQAGASEALGSSAPATRAEPRKQVAPLGGTQHVDATRTESIPTEAVRMDAVSASLNAARADAIHAAAAQADSSPAEVMKIQTAVRSTGSTPPPAVAPRVDASWAGNTPPPYPLAARRQGVQGKVSLDLLIEANGAVGEIRLRESSGSPLLDQSVMQTVKRWRFIPASQQGQTMTAWYPAWEWVFRLEEGS